jgi:hypothetical protein
MVFYKIDGCDEVFRSLRNAKHHVWIAYTHSERFKELQNVDIIKYKDDVAVTKTPIIVTSDGYSFGKTTRL